jgi:hypothetical protein
VAFLLACPPEPPDAVDVTLDPAEAVPVVDPADDVDVADGEAPVADEPDVEPPEVAVDDSSAAVRAFSSWATCLMSAATSD